MHLKTILNATDAINRYKSNVFQCVMTRDIIALFQCVMTRDIIALFQCVMTRDIIAQRMA